MFATRPASPSSPSDIASLLARRKRSPRATPSPGRSRSPSPCPSPSAAAPRSKPLPPSAAIPHDVPMTRTERSPPSSRRHSPIPRPSPPNSAPISPPPAAKRGHVQPPPPPAPAGCHGFVLAHTLPTATDAQKATHDPFALVPCPHATVVPPITPTHCASNCAETMYCPAHWCGSCKRVARAHAREQQASQAAGA